jgi:diguanylate cyclase (GGDEF)-like protein
MNSDMFKLHVSQNWLMLLIGLICLLMIWGIVNVSNTTKPELEISRGVEYLVDVNLEFDSSSIQSLAEDKWQVVQDEQLSFGLSSSPHWLKFNLGKLDQLEPWLLEIDYALLDKVDIWFITQQGVLGEFHTGDTLPFRSRQIKHEKYLFPVPNSIEATEVLLRVQSHSALKLPIRLWQEQAYLVANGEHSIVMGLFFGFLTAMALSNFFLFITTRLKTFLVYSGYVTCLALTLATLHGIGYKYLWPDNIWLQDHAIGIFANATIYLVIIFTDMTLCVSTHSPRVSKFMRLSAAISLFALLLSLFIPYGIFIKFFLVMIILVVILIYGVSTWLWIKGERLARFYTIAWTALLFSAFVASLDNLSLVKLGLPSHYLLMLGATIETFLLALVMALSYNQQRQDNFNSQALALSKERQARAAQEKLLALQEEAKEELEYKVQERTLELEITLRELSESNRELEEKNTLDSLTGIRNRRHFDKKYQAEVRRSRREQTELSVVILDIDHFKKINDEYGHLIGDECIKSVARIMAENVKRPSDDVCRYGGEEFTFILPNTDQAGARQLVERVRMKIEDTPIVSPAGAIKMTISAGICTGVMLPEQKENVLLDAADQCLYQAKKSGRNRVCASYLAVDQTVNQD